VSKTNKKSRKYDEESMVKMPCLKCGIMVEKYLHPDSIRGYRMYCPDHAPERRSHIERECDTSDSSVLYFAHRLFLEQGVSSPVKIYRPGDPEFDAIAAQCSKPTPKKDLPFYDPFEHKNFYDKRDKLS